MPAAKKHRQSLNTKYDRLLKSGPSPGSKRSTHLLTPSIIPTKAQSKASRAQKRQDRSRDRQRLWDSLGMGSEQSYSRSTKPTDDYIEVGHWPPCAGNHPSLLSVEPSVDHQPSERLHSPTPCDAPVSQMAKWPFVADVPIPSSAHAHHQEDQAVSHQLPSLPAPAPIQLLWTPHGIVSCNGEPVQLYYPPNMSLSLPLAAGPPPVAPPSGSNPPCTIDPARQANLDHQIPTSIQPQHRSLPQRTDRAHEPYREAHGYGAAAASAQQSPGRVQHEPLTRPAIRDDLSDSLHSLTVDDEVHWETRRPFRSLEADSQTEDALNEIEERNDTWEEDMLALTPSNAHMPRTNADSRDPHLPREAEQLKKARGGGRAELNGAAPPSDSALESKLGTVRRTSPPRMTSSWESYSVVSDDMLDEPTFNIELSPRPEPMRNGNVQSQQCLPNDATCGLQSEAFGNSPCAIQAPSAPRKMAPEHTPVSEAPAPHTPILRPTKPPMPPALEAPDRHSQDSDEHLQNAPTQSTDSDIDIPFRSKLTAHHSPEYLRGDPNDAEGTADYGSEDELLLKSDDDAEQPRNMAAEVMSNPSGLGVRQMNGGVGRVTPTLPPGCSNTPYHKPGLHTLSQTIFKRRPEAWANLTYLQQPGTNSLDPETPAPPTPTIAPVDVWLGVGETGDSDKRLESIGEVPELEEIEIDADSEAEEVSYEGPFELTHQKPLPEKEEADSIRSFTPSQEVPRKRKKKQVRFNLDHEEFFFEPEPDSRKILGLLKPRPDDDHDVGHETAVYEIGGGTARNTAETGNASQKQHDTDTVSKEPSPSPAPEGKEGDKNDIGFTIYRDGY